MSLYLKLWKMKDREDFNGSQNGRSIQNSTTRNSSMPLGNRNFRVSVKEIQLIILLHSSLPVDLKPSYSHVKLDKLKYLRIFFRK